MGLFNKYCTSKARLVGKTAVITGANTGIGKETARDFYGRGARVILACRNVEAAEKAVEDIKDNPPPGIKRDEYLNNAGELLIYHLDLCSLSNVRNCARSLIKQETAIHILVNNAGVVTTYQKTEDGHETTLQSNHLGHFLLTLLLLPKMQSSTPGCRIVNVSSRAHNSGDIHFEDINLERSYTPFNAYAQSKLMNILFTKELAHRLREANIDGINVYSLHPGVVATDIARHIDSILFSGAHYVFNLLGWLFFKNVWQGAQTTIYCSLDEKVADETGLYYSDCDLTNPHWRAEDKEYAKKLWDISCRLLHLEPDKNLATFLETVSRQIAE